MKNIIILMPWGRVGSNLVLDFIITTLGKQVVFKNESLIAIKSAEEQVNWIRNFFTDSQIDGKYRLLKEGIANMLDPGAIDSIVSNSNIHVIKLFRKSTVKTTVSQIRAEAYARYTEKTKGNAMWAVNLQDQPLGPINIDIDEFIRKYQYIEKMNTILEDRFNSRSTLEIYYEDLLSDMDSTFSKIAKFIQLPEINYQPKYRKATNDDLSKSVTNYNELNRIISEHQYV